MISLILPRPDVSEAALCSAMDLSYISYYIGGLITYLIVFACGTFLFSLGYKRKNKFALRLLLSFAAVAAVSVGIAFLQYYIEMTFANVILTNVTVLLIYTALFILWFFGMKISYDESLLRVLISCVFGGLCQYLSYCLYSILNIIVSLDAYLYITFKQFGYPIGLVVQTIICGGTLVACYFLFAKRIVRLTPPPDRGTGLYIALCLSHLIVSLLNALGNILTSDDTAIQLFVRIVLMICSICIIILYVKMLETRSAKYDFEIVNNLNINEHQHFLKLKQDMELVSIKCHDIKHFINAAGTREGIDLSELGDAVSIYDTTIKTGNDVIDTLLAERKLYCSAHNITLTVLADAEKLDYIGATDICALFGNMLENAVEATGKVSDPARRVININIRPVSGQMFICVENSFDDKPKIIDGMPSTSKEDKTHHGYGLKSIKIITEKYDGVFSYNIEDGIFRVSVLLPLPETGAE